MGKRLCLAIVSVGVLMVLAADTPAGAAITTGATASTRCGTEQTAGGVAHVIAPHGVSCARARKVIHDFVSKGAFWHFVGTNHGNGYSPVDGWRCTLFMGHSDCKRGHAIIRAEPLPLSHVTPSAVLWSALSGKVDCGLAAAGPPSQILCESAVVRPPPGTTNQEGGAGDVFLGATGQPSVVPASQNSFVGCCGEFRQVFVPLRAGDTWRHVSLGIECSIGAADVRCANREGHGFTIGRSSYSSF